MDSGKQPEVPEQNVADEMEAQERDESLDRELMAACASGKLEEVKGLIAKDADVTCNDDAGVTPLHLAAANGHLEIVKTLLLSGAPYNAVDKEYRTPAEHARANGHEHVYEDLVDEGVRAEMILMCLGRSQQKSPKPSNDDYLQQKLTYSEGKLVDAEGNGVMMGWEAPLMDLHAQAMCPKPGLDVLNVGFGLGIIDTELQKYSPRTHTIIEAHPDVYQHMLETGWDKKPGVRILFGRWQDVLEQLEQYDGIFFDTFGEYYEDLREFNENIPDLLRPDGVYTYFNGLAATNPFFHDIYCRLCALELAELGLSTEYTEVDMDASNADWEGIIRKYWTLKKYRLPVCRFDTSYEMVEVAEESGEAAADENAEENQ